MKKMFLPAMMLLFSGFIYADIFESRATDAAADNVPGFDLTGSIHAKINDRKTEISRFRSGEKADKVLNVFYNRAAKEGCQFAEGKALVSLADTLTVQAGGEPGGYFGTLFYADKSGTGTLLAARDSGDGCVIVRIIIDRMRGLEDFTGYQDGIDHMDGTVKVMSLEIMSCGVTKEFTNFYRLNYAPAEKVGAFYRRSLEKKKWNILNEQHDGDVSTVYAEKDGKKRCITIMEESGGGCYICVTG
jgi:hypothetical protein